MYQLTIIKKQSIYNYDICILLHDTVSVLIIMPQIEPFSHLVKGCLATVKVRDGRLSSCRTLSDDSIGKARSATVWMSVVEVLVMVMPAQRSSLDSQAVVPACANTLLRSWYHLMKELTIVLESR